ncbi:hypothetical protein PUN28_002223 [Cardiocondyla obscurior]|uniref:Uncharacterized protein n=1 Tax=Cardiocondyla obscurior TaxID=286306 RepID=A0AAW2GT22_9HYME
MRKLVQKQFLSCCSIENEHDEQGSDVRNLGFLPNNGRMTGYRGRKI